MKWLPSFITVDGGLPPAPPAPPAPWAGPLFSRTCTSFPAKRQGAPSGGEGPSHGCKQGGNLPYTCRNILPLSRHPAAADDRPWSNTWRDPAPAPPRPRVLLATLRRGGFGTTACVWDGASGFGTVRVATRQAAPRRLCLGGLTSPALPGLRFVL